MLSNVSRFFSFTAVAPLLLLLAQSCTTNAQTDGERATPSVDVATKAPAPVSRSRGKPLKAFSMALKDLRAGRRDRVTILHIGDSHTAGDVFSGRLRALFQKDFGLGGRGVLPPGVPFDYFHPKQVKVTQQSNWKAHNSYKRGTAGPFGLSGFRLSGGQGGAIAMESTTGPFQKLSLEFVKGPGRGVLDVTLDGKKVTSVATGSPRGGVGFETLQIPAGASKVSLSPSGNGPVELLSWGTEAARPGIVYHSHGIVGATIDVMSKWDPSIVQAELRVWDPDLIIVAYGTNEGFNDGLDVSAYETRFRRHLTALARGAPNASIVVVGPPDGNRLPAFCSSREGRGCETLSEAERSSYKKLAGAKSEALCRWHPPPKLYAVKEAQERVAAQDGYFFWDWSSVMKGACGMHEWALAGLASKKDHVHLTGKGYTRSADALYRAIRSNL
jgi:lysophospholipase L1-like esterase